MSSIRVFVLGSLAERGPMHGHQLRLLAEKEHVHLWTDFQGGAIYGALKRLQAEELIEPVRVEREGARPERQIVRITDAGRADLESLRQEALLDFAVRPDPFDLALARVGPDLLDDLPAILGTRRGSIAAAIDRHAAALRDAAPHLTRAETHVLRHTTRRLAAELAWLDEVLADLPAVVADERTREVD